MWREQEKSEYLFVQTWYLYEDMIIIFEANSSIEYFNNNDETVLQGETQYKHAE